MDRLCTPKLELLLFTIKNDFSLEQAAKETTDNAIQSAVLFHHEHYKVAVRRAVGTTLAAIYALFKDLRDQRNGSDGTMMAHALRDLKDMIPHCSDWAWLKLLEPTRNDLLLFYGRDWYRTLHALLTSGGDERGKQIANLMKVSCPIPGARAASPPGRA